MLQFDGIELLRGGRRLFHQASFRIHPGQKVGLSGRNGTGKSSLLALVLGRLEAEAGHWQMPAGWQVAHVAQQSPSGTICALDFVLDGDQELRQLQRDIVAAEQAGDGHLSSELHGRMEAIDGYRAPARAGRLLNGLGFAPGDEAHAVDSFSGGWRMRLNLARALMCRSDLLLLDEPTNHLDLEAVFWLERWLAQYPGALILISHDREFLDAVAEQILHIENQQVRLYRGNYSTFERTRAEQLRNQQSAYQAQQAQIEQLQRFVERFRAKATKARQAQSRLKTLERMERIAPAHLDSPFCFSFVGDEHYPDPLLRLDRVAVGYDGQTAVLRGVNLAIRPGDRIGLVGANGAGKSTLIKLLAGVLAVQAGDMTPAKDLTVGYFAQHQLEQLDPAASPMTHLLRLDPDLPEQKARDFLGGFQFGGERAEQGCATFSGGEKARLALALMVFRRPALLLLDEPTNHLDIEMRLALSEALQMFSGAMLLVSHDRHMIRSTCDELLLVEDGRVSPFDGTLEDYYAHSQQRQAPQRDPADAAAPVEGSAEARRQRKRQQAEQRQRLRPARQQVQRLEGEMARFERQREELERQLADAGLYQDAHKERLKQLLLDKAQLDQRCQTCEDDWFLAQEELERLERELA
jgi:ATP-binding cassette subfamily F protein 3